MNGKEKEILNLNFEKERRRMEREGRILDFFFFCGRVETEEKIQNEAAVGQCLRIEKKSRKFSKKALISQQK